MRIALVHDDFSQLGGAERLFEEITRIYPDAPIYTSLVNTSTLPRSIDAKRIRTSFMQKIPFATKFYKLFLPLYPFAFESFDFSGFDMVISSTTRFAKSIITGPHTIHICYINSTPRFLYNQDQTDQYLSPLSRFIAKPYLSWLRRWDKVASSRVDYYIANSQNIQKSVLDQYNRESTIIHPFADTDFFTVKSERVIDPKSESYYLIVSRLVKWKKIDLAIEACRQLGINLKIVGKGPDEEKLKRIVTSGQKSETRIEFLGNITREELRELYQNSQALIVTQEEDFGISAVEAQSCGTPVIAYHKGGQIEIIKEGKTGILFQDQTVKSLKDAILTLSRLKYNIPQVRKNALRFTRSRFKKELEATITTYAKTN